MNEIMPYLSTLMFKLTIITDNYSWLSGAVNWFAKKFGSYGTLGLAEDTWAMNEGVLDEEAFIDQAKRVWPIWSEYQTGEEYLEIEQCRSEREVCEEPVEVCEDKEVSCEYDEENQEYFRYEKICIEEGEECFNVRTICDCEEGDE